MAIELKNSMFIHIPKCGGRKIKALLKEYVSNVKIIGDEIYDSHSTPNTNKKVFGFIRHPATFLHSLWHHRSKIKGNKFGKRWNWQNYIKLENECKSENFITFFRNVSQKKNYVWDYYHHYLGGYNNPQYGCMENLIESFIQILKYNNEVFDEKGIRAQKDFIGANNKSKPATLNNVKKIVGSKAISDLIKSENILSERFKYNEI